MDFAYLYLKFTIQKLHKISCRHSASSRQKSLRLKLPLFVFDLLNVDNSNMVFSLSNFPNSDILLIISPSIAVVTLTLASVEVNLAFSWPRIDVMISQSKFLVLWMMSNQFKTSIHAIHNHQYVRVLISCD